MRLNGWVAMPRALLNNTHTSLLSSSEQLVLLTLWMLADARTGSGRINGPSLRTWVPDLSYDAAKRCLLSLEEKRLIYRQIVHRSKAVYAGEPVKAEARLFREADARSIGKLPERPVRLGPDNDPDVPRSRRKKKVSESKPKPETPTPKKKFCARCNAALRTWSESDLCYPCTESNGLPTLRDARRGARKRRKADENSSTK